MTVNPDNFSAILQLPFAVIGVTVEDDVITGIRFLPEGTPAKASKDDLVDHLLQQLQQYLADPASARMDLPVRISGTAFQRRVWAALRKIPPGQALTYGELAHQLNTGARAVGNACRRNPLPLIVPCHRVVSSNGIGGFAGDRNDGWTRVKHWLLDHEGYTNATLLTRH